MRGTGGGLQDLLYDEDSKHIYNSCRTGHVPVIGFEERVFSSGVGYTALQSCMECLRVADADRREPNDIWNACTRLGVAISPRQTLAASIVQIW